MAMGLNRYKNYIFVIKLLSFSFLSLLINSSLYSCKRSKADNEYYEPIPLATHVNGQNFVGSQSCVECHSDISQSHIRTAHYKTSALVDSGSVKASFENGKNRYHLNDDVVFDMTISRNGIFQAASSVADGKQFSKSKIDVVIGSGTKGQSYLNWSNDSLYQLQISYFTPTDNWANSPGMPSEILVQPRPVNAKCMECHTTFAKNTSLYGMGNRYDKQQIIYGIDCERCHGPSEGHAVFHRNNTELQEPRYMMKYDTLSRQQRLDACALCHSGVSQNA